MTIEWEDPPPKQYGKGKGKGKNIAFVSALAEHPGKWACYSRSTPDNGSNLKDVAARLGVQIEVTSRRNAPNARDFTVYARVVE